MRLTPLIILSVFFSILLPVSVAGWLIIDEKRTEILEQLHSYHSGLVKNLQSSLSDAVWAYRYDIAQDIIKPLLSSELVTEIRVIDDNGKQFLKEVDSGTLPKESTTLSLPIEKNGLHVGEVHVTLSLDKTNEEIRDEIVKILLLMFVLMMTIFMVIYFILKHYVIYPVEKLYHESRKMIDGQFDDPVAIGGAYEITVLGKYIDDARLRIKTLIHDLNERFNELKETQDKLIEAEKMASLGNLVAGIAHEVNTPLGISVTSASHLRAKTNELKSLFETGNMKKSVLEKYIETADESMEITLKSLNRASELIQHFKRVAVDENDERIVTFDLVAYTEDILEMLDSKLRQANVEITLDSNRDISFNGYPGLYSQVLTNLVMNALIHAFDTGEQGQIAVEIKDENENVSVRIQDNGKGIPEQNRDKIFEPFFTTKRNQGGTGLGLHIVYNIITQKMAGEIYLDDALESGTAFVIRLPKKIVYSV